MRFTLTTSEIGFPSISLWFHLFSESIPSPSQATEHEEPEKPKHTAKTATVETGKHYSQL